MFKVILMLLLLSGCAQMQMQKSQDMQQKFLAGRNECALRYQQGIYKTYSERVACVNDASLTSALQYQYPYMDLIVLGNAYRASFAKRIDEGTLSETEAGLLQAQLGVFIGQEEQKRNLEMSHAQSERQISNAATAASIGNILQGMAAYQQSNQVHVRSPITCIQTGNVVNCN